MSLSVSILKYDTTRVSPRHLASAVHHVVWHDSGPQQGGGDLIAQFVLPAQVDEPFLRYAKFAADVFNATCGRSFRRSGS